MTGSVTIKNVDYRFRVSSMGTVYLSIDGDEVSAMGYLSENDYKDCMNQVVNNYLHS